MSGLAKKIELLANVAIITLALLIGGFFVKRYFFDDGRMEEVRAGEKISLSGMDWTKSPRTLLIALQTGCRYCSESAPFYQRVVREIQGQSNIRLVAILPQPIDEGQKYLSELSVSVDEIRQESLSSIKIGGSPTLMLINNAGVMTDVWRGKLTPEQESEVLNRLKAFETVKSADIE